MRLCLYQGSERVLGGEVKKRVNQCGGFLLRQQCLSITQQQQSLEKGSSGGGSVCAAPYVLNLSHCSQPLQVEIWDCRSVGGAKTHCKGMNTCRMVLLGSLTTTGVVRHHHCITPCFFTLISSDAECQK